MFEGGVINLGHGVIVSWFGDITRLLKLEPSHFIGIKFVCFLAFWIIQHSTKNDCFMLEHGGLMMGNVSRDSSFLNYAFPLDSWILVLIKIRECIQVNSPHCGNGAHFDVSSSMNVHTAWTNWMVSNGFNLLKIKWRCNNWFKLTGHW